MLLECKAEEGEGFHLDSPGVDRVSWPTPCGSVVSARPSHEGRFLNDAFKTI